MAADNHEELMMQAAIMYYRDDMTQDEIAKKLYLSRTKVSRLLKLAKETNKVEIRLNEAWHRNVFLEKMFRTLFGLEDAVILSDLPEDSKKAFWSLAKGAADYIDTILKPDSIVGIGRGETLHAIVDCMEPGRKLPIKVVQLIGLLNNPSKNEEEMELVWKFANAYGGTFYNLFTPFVLTDKEARQVLNHVAAVGKSIEVAGKADIVLTSLGKIDVADRNILWNSYLSKEEKGYVLEKEPLGLFCGRYYDINGEIIEMELHDRIFGLEVDEIVKKEHVIGVSMGREKVLPILGALRGKLIKTLITDERTALNVLIRDGRMV